MKIYLASTSKFKKNILDNVYINHECIEPDFNEKDVIQKEVDKYVMELAYGKAKSVLNKVNEGIIIGLDTVVLINNKIVEKPKDLEEAKCNLENSSNNETKVITGIALINVLTNERLIDYQVSNVVFNKIRKEDIDFYLENEKDALYASGFIIENIASNFIKEINGSYYNILGVPVEKIYDMLNYFGVYLKDIDR